MDLDGISLDWKISMTTARQIAGPDRVLAGNIDPIVLYGSKQNIRSAVEQCIRDAGGHHVLNLGHGVEKDIDESAVQTLVDAVRDASTVHRM